MPITAKENQHKADAATEAAVTYLTIDDTVEGQRVDNFLLTHLKRVPQSHIYRILRSGEVRINKGRIAADYRLQAGDVLRIPPVRIAVARPDEQPASARMHQRGIRFEILYEDEALLALNKPAGMAVHGGSGISLGVIEALRQIRPEARFLELVHRLDRETSGVLLLAKKRSALTILHAQLRGEAKTRADKRYIALVKGQWPDEKRHVRLRLAKYVIANGERRVAVDEDNGVEAHTVFSRMENFADATLLEADIRTGRTHQIRVHLTHLGFPILGDDKYGDFPLNKSIAAARNGGLKRMFLHAHFFATQHPLTGLHLEIRAPLPSDLEHYLHYLREGIKAASEPRSRLR